MHKREGTRIYPSRLPITLSTGSFPFVKWAVSIDHGLTILGLERPSTDLRRGGGAEHVPLDHVTVASDDPPETVLAINEALDRLTGRDPFKAEVVKMRYFVGLSQDEIAHALDVSVPTIRRHWAIARAWLYAEMKTPSK